MPWGSNPGFSSNKPSHYLLGHGDHNKIIIYTKKTKRHVATAFIDIAPTLPYFYPQVVIMALNVCSRFQIDLIKINSDLKIQAINFSSVIFDVNRTIFTLNRIKVTLNTAQLAV